MAESKAVRVQGKAEGSGTMECRVTKRGRDRGEIGRWAGFEVHPAIVNGAVFQATKF